MEEEPPHPSKRCRDRSLPDHIGATLGLLSDTDVVPLPLQPLQLSTVPEPPQQQQQQQQPQLGSLQERPSDDAPGKRKRRAFLSVLRPEAPVQPGDVTTVIPELALRAAARAWASQHAGQWCKNVILGALRQPYGHQATGFVTSAPCHECTGCGKDSGFWYQFRGRQAGGQYLLQVMFASGRHRLYELQLAHNRS